MYMVPLELCSARPTELYRAALGHWQSLHFRQIKVRMNIPGAFSPNIHPLLPFAWEPGRITPLHRPWALPAQHRETGTGGGRDK